MKQLELKIPAPIVALVAMALMYLTRLLLPLMGLSVRVRFVIAAVSLLVAVGIAFLGFLKFLNAKTTVRPDPKQTTSLVTDGIYRYTRNPMYLGMVVGLIGFAFFLDSAFALVWTVAFVAYITRFQIVPEERILTIKFPKEYKTYKQKVRRWV